MSDVIPLIERLRSLSIPEPNSGCWLWVGCINPNGYGTIHVKKEGVWKTCYAHRISYEQFVGQIPEGLEIDHLCRVQSCINPDHLESVTRSENMLRIPLLGRFQSSKITCPRGHPYSRANARGYRSCHICHAEQNRRFRARKKAAALRLNAVIGSIE